MKEGWKTVKLGEVCTFQRGLTYAKKDESLLPTRNIVLRSNNINLGTNLLDFDELKFLKKDFFIPQNKKIRKGTLLMCMSNGSKQHIGKVAYIYEDFPFAFGGFMGLIIPNVTIIGKYLFYICISDLFKHFLTYISNGINISNLKFSDLSNFPFPLPPLSEQQSIVEELDLLNLIISKKKQQLKELDSLEQAIFYNMFGDPVDNEKGWEVKTYGEKFDIGSGGTPSKTVAEYWENGNIPWIGSNLCQNNILYETDGKYITEDGLNNSSAKLLNKGTVLVALVGATIGKVALLKSETSTNQNIAFIKVESNKDFNPYFIFYNTMGLHDLFMNIGQGKFKMANLSFIRKLPLILPPLPLQQTFASKIEEIENIKSRINGSIADTEQLLNATMDKYFG